MAKMCNSQESSSTVQLFSNSSGGGASAESLTHSDNESPVTEFAVYEANGQLTVANGPGPVEVSTNLTTVVVQACPGYCHPDIPYSLSKHEESQLALVVYQFLNRHGPMSSTIPVPIVADTPTISWVVEYNDIVPALAAVCATGADKGSFAVIEGVCVWILLFKPVAWLDLAVHSPELAMQYLPAGTSEGDVSLCLYERAMVRRMVPLGRGLNIVDQGSRPHPSRLPPERQQDFVLTFDPNFSLGMDYSALGRDLSNTVINAKIRHGHDVRTTVMLRNIPNCIKQEDLVLLLNDCVPGRFDFVYLRIDFTNGCNVGYGFVNFIHADVILELIEAVAFKRWANSTKMAELCYATWQGVEAMIAKFRNSAVMCQHHSARPKLFYTVMDGHNLCGLEKPFPDADNDFKLHQSLMNAGNIGLYPSRRGFPSSLQTGRRRHGDFDRGTTYDIHQQLHMPTVQRRHAMCSTPQPQLT